MKKIIWIARVADDNSDTYKACFDKKAAEDTAYGYYWHLTDKEKATHTVSVEGYEVEVPDDDRSAEDIFNDMLISDNPAINEPDVYNEVHCYDVYFAGGQSRYGNMAVNYMLCNVNDRELYAEEVVPDNISDEALLEFDIESYERLKAEISRQAVANDIICPSFLRYFYDS